MRFHPDPLVPNTPRRPNRRYGRPSGPRMVTVLVLQFRTTSRSPTTLAWRPSTFGSIELTLETYPFRGPNGPWPRAAGASASTRAAVAKSNRVITTSSPTLVAVRNESEYVPPRRDTVMHTRGEVMLRPKRFGVCMLALGCFA